MSQERITSSFRDPSGYVVLEDDAIKRIIQPIYFAPYDALQQSGFYDKLFDQHYLIRHREISRSQTQIVLEAEKIPFVTYPYEWSFLQYKHAALLTLKIQKYCLEHGFSLKDATAFNVTFHQGKPVFIDTLSFDFYQQDQPWHAYKQFVMHFLGPLVLSKYYGHDFLKTLAHEIDGIPLKKLAQLLPWKSKLNPTLWANIHLLARYDDKFSAGSGDKGVQKLSKSAQIKLLTGLYDYIKDLDAKESTEWDHYYSQTNYNDAAYAIKKEKVKDWFEQIGRGKIIDLGGNDGTFARALGSNELVLVADIDPNAVGQNYRQIQQNKETNIVPLVADALNPAGGYGFNNEERFSLIDRLEKLQLSGCLALAVIHHLTLSGNIPFEMSARFFARLAPNLLIEFPTRDDSWVQYLLESKREFKAHFDFYDESNFEQGFGTVFQLVKKEPIEGSARILYHFKRR